MSRVVSIRLTDEVLDLIDSHTEKNSGNRSSIIRDACLEYLGNIKRGEDVAYVKISSENSLKLKRLASQLNKDHDKLMDQLMNNLFEQMAANPYPEDEQLMPETLKEVYEEIFRNIIDGLPNEKTYKSSPVMQSLKYFFTYLCTHRIHPEIMAEEDVKSFFLYKYTTGTSLSTLKWYFWPIKNYYLRFHHPELKFQPEQIEVWIKQWEEEGVPTDLPALKSKVEVSYQVSPNELCDTVNSLRPRKKPNKR